MGQSGACTPKGEVCPAPPRPTANGACQRREPPSQGGPGQGLRLGAPKLPWVVCDTALRVLPTPKELGTGVGLTWTLAPSPHCSRGLLCPLPLHTFPLGPWGPAQVTCSVPSPALYFRGLGRGFDTGAAGRGSRAKWGHWEGCTGQWSAWIRAGVLSLGLRGGLGSEAAAWQRGACWRVWAAAPWRAGGFQGASQG